MVKVPDPFNLTPEQKQVQDIINGVRSRPAGRMLPDIGNVNPGLDINGGKGRINNDIPFELNPVERGGVIRNLPYRPGDFSPIERMPAPEKTGGFLEAIKAFFSQIFGGAAKPQAPVQQNPLAALSSPVSKVTGAYTVGIGTAPPGMQGGMGTFVGYSDYKTRKPPVKMLSPEELAKQADIQEARAKNNSVQALNNKMQNTLADFSDDKIRERKAAKSSFVTYDADYVPLDRVNHTPIKTTAELTRDTVRTTRFDPGVETSATRKQASDYARMNASANADKVAIDAKYGNMEIGGDAFTQWREKKVDLAKAGLGLMPGENISMSKIDASENAKARGTMVAANKKIKTSALKTAANAKEVDAEYALLAADKAAIAANERKLDLQGKREAAKQVLKAQEVALNGGFDARDVGRTDGMPSEPPRATPGGPANANKRSV